MMAQPQIQAAVLMSDQFRAMQLERACTPLRAVKRHLRPVRPGEVRISVLACAVCRTDLHVVDGELPDPVLPIIPGHEIVGRVEEVGQDVGLLKPGDRVGVPWLGWTCGICEFCTTGRENLCPGARFTGYQIDGGFAAAAYADARYMFPVPLRFGDLRVRASLMRGPDRLAGAESSGPRRTPWALWFRRGSAYCRSGGALSGTGSVCFCPAG